MAIAIIYFPYTKEVLIKTELTEITRTYYSAVVNCAQIMATGLMLFIVWIWKKELGISSVGSITGESIEKDLELPNDTKTDDTTVLNSPDESSNEANASDENTEQIVQPQTTSDEGSNSKSEVEREFKRIPIKINHTDNSRRFKENVMSLIRKKQFVTSAQMTRTLGANILMLHAVLDELIKENKIEISKYNGKFLYIDSNNIENKAIDWLTRNNLKDYNITNIYKFVRFDQVDYDAVAESDSKIIFIEIKNYTQDINNKIERFKKLSSIHGQRYKDKECVWILGIVSEDSEIDYSSHNEKLNNFVVYNIPFREIN